jgi:hypothetical protein
MKATCAKNAASIFASGELGFAIAVASTVASDSRTQAKTAIQIAALSGKWRKIAPWVTPMRSAMACAVIASGPRSRASTRTAATISRCRSSLFRRWRGVVWSVVGVSIAGAYLNYC